MIVLSILATVVFAFAPTFLAYRLKEKNLMWISVVTGAVSIIGMFVIVFIILPIHLIAWAVTTILIVRKLPKDIKPPIHFSVFIGVWAVVLLLFLFAPIVHVNALVTDVSLSGIDFFREPDSAKALVVYALSDSEVVGGFYMIIFPLAASLIASCCCIYNRSIIAGQIIACMSCMPALILIGGFSVDSHVKFNFSMYLIIFLIIAVGSSIYYVSEKSVAAAGAAPIQIGSVIKPHSNPQQGYAESQQTYSQPQQSYQQPRQTYRSQVASATIFGVNGEYSGATFRIAPGEKLVLGSDPTRVNVVFSSKTVSRVHCIITCPPQADTIRISDQSTNGTYIENGDRLPYNTQVDLKLPLRFFFGDGPQTFEIR